MEVEGKITTFYDLNEGLHSGQGKLNYSLLFRRTVDSLQYTTVSTKVVPQKCKSVRDNADWYYG